MSRADDFLVEVGTEELPPTALKNLMNAFASGVEDGLDNARLEHGEVTAFASPRRLAVIVTALDNDQTDREIVQKGPPVSIAFDDSGQPTKAALAFAKKFGVEVDSLGREESKDGEWVSYKAIEKGQSAAQLLPDIIQKALDGLPIPRRMRWGEHDADFVRPVHWLILLHGKKTVPGSVLGISSDNKSRGHRFHSTGEIEIGSPTGYLRALEDRGHVIVDFHLRRERIVSAVIDAATRAGGSVVAENALFDEVTALTEWPVAVTGSFDKEFLELPNEVIVATLTSHQRYFPVQDADGQLLPTFITLANLDSREPDRVREGNEKVIRPRLADATFFWESDRQTALSDRKEALKNVVYQKGLGTLHDKSCRVTNLATQMADSLDIDAKTVSRAAELAKCDLLTGMVGEFPELQGTMGAYYAGASGETPDVAQAIGEQYLPRFAGDDLPVSKAGQILAMVDKLDTLAGVFRLGKRPSGNRDPFGLRRAALGVVRILIEHELNVDLSDAVKTAVLEQPAQETDLEECTVALHDFIVDRLKRYFVDSDLGISVDMFEAVRARQPSTLVDFDARLRAVAAFVEMEPAVSLAAANKRTANILRQAGFEDMNQSALALDSSMLQEEAEQSLFEAMQSAKKDVAPLIEGHAFEAALRRLSELRAVVDAFFDDVMVMVEDEALQKNRLALLAELRGLFLDVADISRLTLSQD